jgi:hypothetical protein
MKYHKIQTMFKRDPDTGNIIYGDWALPEFEYLANNKWIFTEKVDGECVRIEFDDSCVGTPVFFKHGKNNAARVRSILHPKLRERIASWGPTLRQQHAGLTLYGEGYGNRIQKRGKLYHPNQDFILFDVRAGRWWLKREDIVEIAEKLKLEVVPIIGEGTLYDAIELVKTGLKSTWGDFEAEGIVARPAVELFARSGARMICKIKAKDFMTKGKDNGRTKG